jgi:diguanylate cyclase (GGDEF)-like protein
MGDGALVNIATLRTLDTLRGIGDETLEALLSRCECLRVGPGQVLMRRGDPNTRMYVVVFGLVRVVVDEREAAPLARLGPGDPVGEMSLLVNGPASATVICEEPSCLLGIDQQTFCWLIGASHGFAVSLLIRLADRLRTNNDAVQANIALRRKFEQAALHDPLTGAHSRRWLDDTLPRVVQRHRFSSDPLSLLVLDVDHFKRINDTFGHPAGDSVLGAVGRVIREKLRPTDLVARFGGEEFVLILPHTPLAGAVRAAERLREAIALAPMSHDGANLPNVTVSLGVASLGRHLVDAPKLLAAADQALYRAKAAGRNRSESSDGATVGSCVKMGGVATPEGRGPAGSGS